MRRAIVVGRSRDALIEYAEASALCDFDDIVVVGEMGVHFPARIDHWVSFHAELFGSWARRRAAAGAPPAGRYWTAIYHGRRLGGRLRDCPPLSWVPCEGGSSGFMGVRVALREVGADRVVLAGVPMVAGAAHYGSDEPWDEADKYWSVWVEHMDEMRGRVRSMSGRTRAALGAPDKEWLGV